MGGNSCFHQVLFRPFFRARIIWDVWGCPSPPLQVVPSWTFCSSQPLCLCIVQETQILQNPNQALKERIHQRKPEENLLGSGGGSDRYTGSPSGLVLSQTTLVKHNIWGNKCPFFLKTFWKRSLFWKLHFFFPQRTSENTDFYLFVLFSIISYILLFLFHFQCLDSPVLPVRENVPLSGKFQGCVWVKPPRDVWPWACWNWTFIHSEQTFFFFFVAVPEKFLVSACAVSNVSHSKHSLCFLAHKTAEVHPVQWTNYSALSRYLC